MASSTKAAVQAFLEEEVARLDAGDLAGWLDLCTDDAEYWMPVSRRQSDPLGEISILYENRTLMELRRNNFGHPLSPAFESEVACSHLLGPVRLTGGDEGEVHAKVKFHCIMWYREEQRLFAGDASYRLVPHGKTYKLRFKRVDLINAEAAHKSIPTYL